ncbi:MAG: VOC family protein [Bacteroidota bacterium]
MSVAPFLLPPPTQIRSVDLQVSDLARVLGFYHDILGFRILRQDGSTAWLSADGGSPYRIALARLPGAIPRPRRSTGLFHVAIRYPTESALAIALQHLLKHQYPLNGAADHGVSRALYLVDPDGIGIELYTDRMRSEWPMNGSELAMVTEELDMRGLISMAGGSGWSGIDPATDIGHVHLQVSSLDKAKQFYCNSLGFQVTQSSYPGALFVAAGGYHHHIGLNTWASLNAPPAPSESVGLLRFTIATDRVALIHLADQVGLALEEGANQLNLTDPDGMKLSVIAGD